MEPLLRGRLGRPYTFVDRCDSTQRLLPDDAPEGAAVATDEQTEGRGRLGRRWEAAPGSSLLVSLRLLPDVPSDRLPELTVVAAEAVAESVRALTGLDAAVKHPNDVLVGGRKIAGVLAEAVDGRVTLGIGVNVHQPPDELPRDTRLPATSSPPRAPTSTAPSCSSTRSSGWSGATTPGSAVSPGSAVRRCGSRRGPAPRRSRGGAKPRTPRRRDASPWSAAAGRRPAR